MNIANRGEMKIKEKIKELKEYIVDLIYMIKKYHPLWISIQFNHPKEITKEVRKVCEK